MAERREKNWQKIKSRNETSTFHITGHTQRAYIPGSGAAFLGPRLRREAVISTQFSKQKIRTSTEHTGGWRAIFRNKTSLSMPIICLKEVSSKQQMIWWKLPIYPSLLTVNCHWNSHLSVSPIDLFSWKWKKKMFCTSREKYMISVFQCHLSLLVTHSSNAHSPKMGGLVN